VNRGAEKFVDQGVGEFDAFAAGDDLPELF